ncbi:receptor-like protein 33 [Syzygium oleosum]|uniref:receptor-like protein 33 n=1 Tax=Syzygium oleosum TaxID=219896 RepID=UPI0024BB866B|nr:receptor-like protein 33 [Syzygium oleosum]
MAPSLSYMFCTWIVFLLAAFLTSCADSLGLADECSALIEFKRSFPTIRADFPCVYPKAESWLPDVHGDCCSWDGVECHEATGHVTGLDLSGSFYVFNGNLSGFIPALQWGSPLKSLSLWGTNFTGEIPISIGNLVFLKELSIGNCPFSGLLPASLGNLSQLTYLDASRNKFRGPIPDSFANLTQLAFLDLHSNNFSGDIWHWLGNLAKLTLFDLSDAQFSGPIASSFENLTRLVVLKLSSNNLQGEIPNSLWELKDIEYLDLSQNNLSGYVDLHKLKNMETLRLDSNNISFVSKTEINATLPKLSWLNLDSCNLHEFPKFLGYLSGLEKVSLSHNKFGGSIPTWLWNGSRDSLMYIDLSHNFLTGWGKNQINLLLPQLTYLDISSNFLKTTLPSPPPSATYYNVSDNILFGGIQSICGGRSLAILDLSISSLTGNIPSCWEIWILCQF